MTQPGTPDVQPAPALAVVERAGLEHVGRPASKPLPATEVPVP